MNVMQMEEWVLATRCAQTLMDHLSVVAYLDSIKLDTTVLVRAVMLLIDSITDKLDTHLLY